MIKTLLRLFVIANCLWLTACGVFFGDDGMFRNRGSDYQHAESIEPIAVPESSRERLQELYVVPNLSDAGYDYDQNFEVPRPQPLSSALLSDTVKIQRLSGEQWIFISNSPAEVWPQVIEFLGSYNIPVASTDPETGLIDTHWLAFNDAPDISNRFRLRIETGVQPDSAEIHIVQTEVSDPALLKEEPIWPKTSTSPAREAWMVDELSNTLAANLERSSSSLLAQTIGADDKAVIEKNKNKEPVLRIKLSFDRSWASMMHATGEAGFHTFGSEKSLGAFYLDYRELKEQPENPGWFSRSIRAVKGAFGGDTDPNALPTSPYTIADVLTHLPDNAATRELFSQNESTGGTLENVPGYLVLVRGIDDLIEVRIRDGYAQLIDEKEAQRLLGILRSNLI